MEPKGRVPFAWDCATDTDPEPFLVSKGRTLEWFVQKAVWQNNNSSVIPGKVLLGWFYPKLGSMLSALDARELPFPLITLHNRNWMPNVTSRRIRKRPPIPNGWIGISIPSQAPSSWRRPACCRCRISTGMSWSAISGTWNG